MELDENKNKASDVVQDLAKHTGSGLKIILVYESNLRSPIKPGMKIQI